MTSLETLFKLIRLAFGTVDEFCFPDSLHWEEVYELSCRQGIPAVAFDGLRKVYEGDPKLGKELDSSGLKAHKYNWYASCVASESDFEKHKRILNEICAGCANGGIKILLLKGLGCGLNYPVPAHRSCGDIDIFPLGGREAWEKVNSLLLAYGSEVKKTTDKHSVAKVEGVTIENHAHLLDESEYRADAKAEAILSCADNESLLFIDPYYIFPHTENWFYLLCHMSQHFCANGELSIRQFLDLALLLDRHREDIDVAKCYDWLGRTGYQKMNDLMVSLSQDITGFDLKDFIFERPSEIEKNRVMAELLARDRKLDFPKGLPARMIYKIRKMQGNRWKYSYVPRTFSERIIGSIKSHLLHPEKI